jgi:hypothetical protein
MRFFPVYLLGILHPAHLGNWNWKFNTKEHKAGLRVISIDILEEAHTFLQLSYLSPRPLSTVSLHRKKKN